MIDSDRMMNWLYIKQIINLIKILLEYAIICFLFFQNVYVNINRILSVGSRMVESGHYASAHIRSVASKLERAWKQFAAGLDERTAVLALSVLFHHKAEQVTHMVRNG